MKVVVLVLKLRLKAILIETGLEAIVDAGWNNWHRLLCAILNLDMQSNIWNRTLDIDNVVHTNTLFLTCYHYFDLHIA